MSIHPNHTSLVRTLRESLVHHLSTKLGIGISPEQADDIARNLAQVVVGLVEPCEPEQTVVDALRGWRPTDEVGL